jgi:biofilm PGA synthesis N-glycosyltransferase PgaC
VPVTILVPAYNEGATLEDTLISLLTQSVAPSEILVIDDCSTDDTALVAERLGVTVIRPVRNTGSKAGAQSFPCARKTPFVMAIDADTTLAPDAIELMPAFDDPRSWPRAARSFRGEFSRWERAIRQYPRSFHKRVQEAGAPLIASGCFDVLRQRGARRGGWPTRTLAEDMD